MNEFVGVTSCPGDYASLQWLKRRALMFERIAIPELDMGLHVSTQKVAHELEWLWSKNIIFEVPSYDDKWRQITNKDFEKYHGLKEQQDQKFGELLKAIHDGKEVYRDEWRETLFLWEEYYLRHVSIQLRELQKIQAYPVFPTDVYSFCEVQAGKSEVISIVINALPMPSDSISWEEIVDYRSDPDSVGKFLGLRDWMSEVVRSGLTSIEVIEKLEWLIYEYRRHMELHKLKANVGTFETILIAGVEFLTRFKLESAAKSLFSLKHRRIALMENEMKAPGHEIAYIVKAQNLFS